MSRILVVEDEEDLAELLTYNLKVEGHEVQCAGTGAAATTLLRTFRPELVLLDLMLPDVLGTDIARFIKSDPELAKTHIIIASAKGQESDRILGLELGADDYVAKPFSVRELMLRVKAVLRRPDFAGSTPSDTIFKIGQLELNATAHVVSVDGRPIELTALEFRLLQLFLERQGRVQTRETLLSDVWQVHSEIHTRTVDTHVKRLREKLGPAGALIETVRGVGYKLTSP
jgi:two-component system, OmpR family, phosphate regulon response regulator PhoB